jgi:hypothetical protein
MATHTSRFNPSAIYLCLKALDVAERISDLLRESFENDTCEPRFDWDTYVDQLETELDQRSQRVSHHLASPALFEVEEKTQYRQEMLLQIISELGQVQDLLDITETPRDQMTLFIRAKVVFGLMDECVPMYVTESDLGCISECEPPSQTEVDVTPEGGISQ